MRILIMGGTTFVGRHIAAAAIESGHDITLFRRGRTGPDLFSVAAHVLGDRNSDQDLAALGGGRWDATIDVNAYVPRQVSQSIDEIREHELRSPPPRRTERA
jgi:2'-hydroxyisoflavone reductase